MGNVYLSKDDIDYISRVVATEVPGSLRTKDPETYNRMVAAVVDTITNRVASPEYPNSVEGVANQSRQFSKITGPSRLNPYGSIQNTPVAPDYVQQAVTNVIADRVQGVPSEIGGSMNYANPNFSDARNLRDWINPMIEAGAVKLGLGNAVHYHGIVPGTNPAPDYTLAASGIPSGNIPVPTFKDNLIAPPVNQGLLAAYDQPVAATASPFDAVLANNSVMPVQRGVLDDLPTTQPIASMAKSVVPQTSSIAPVNIDNIIRYDALQDTPMPAEDYTPPASVPQPQSAVTANNDLSAPIQAPQENSNQSISAPIAAPPQEEKKAGLLSKLGITKEQVIGGVLGNAALGPLGGLLGALAGNYVGKNGGLNGMFNSSPLNINRIGGGLNNIAAIYGGAPRGTQAFANNGGLITALGGGRTAYTNPMGATTVELPGGVMAADWSGRNYGILGG